MWYAKENGAEASKIHAHFAELRFVEVLQSDRMRRVYLRLEKKK